MIFRGTLGNLCTIKLTSLGNNFQLLPLRRKPGKLIKKTCLFVPSVTRRFDGDLKIIPPWANSSWSHTDLQRLKRGRITAQVKKLTQFGVNENRQTKSNRVNVKWAMVLLCRNVYDNSFFNKIRTAASQSQSSHFTLNLLNKIMVRQITALAPSEPSERVSHHK